MIELFYKPRDIVFSAPQILWLIEHREILSEGMWPPECVETGYSGQNGKSRGHAATFETPVMCIAEVNARLDTVRDVVLELDARLTAARVDGKLLIAEVEAGKTMGELSYEARTILFYLAGWRRKRMSLTAWRAQWRYRHKLTIKNNQTTSGLDKIRTTVLK